MIDMPLSVFAWLIVVFLQFVIHYLVMGRRRQPRRALEIVSELPASQDHEQIMSDEVAENTRIADHGDDEDLSCYSDEDDDDVVSTASLPNDEKGDSEILCQSPTTVLDAHEDFVCPKEDDDDDWSCRVDERDLKQDLLHKEIMKNYYYSMPQLPYIANELDTPEKTPQSEKATNNTGRCSPTQVACRDEIFDGKTRNCVTFE
mmetsp:Transcript_21677/g.26843  ORF Transcript_21677/g.26843 Transcript_21677/m.26843 type:complete len:203 (-) Transcript_21677:444-1052(-)|eukprot:CAMPEP_0172512478 /NCGR_PEP_ID=MMETSP1066-20121228/245039_1 /TAXON_ID=671091 /ORGANISM="Coscinodiscus wailesii, Strain CCMP2513" /LENGTH=202 /DNA_ID=CAMNT_0013292323 /DNA_START=148 /DNA_END=756 /DNA_ORIENTATION=+